MNDRYPDQNERRWPFVLAAVVFWSLAVWFACLGVALLAISLFVCGLSMIWPNLFYRREGVGRLKAWVEWFR
ncbi:hypothetical protein [Pseudomonas sp. DC3000-4b1]|uniref:hypothetical protein n=1 Tax=unclassified Pseudomonas TaxID=196821 RepID=UPI003CF0111E